MHVCVHKLLYLAPLAVPWHYSYSRYSSTVWVRDPEGLILQSFDTIGHPQIDTLTLTLTQILTLTSTSTLTLTPTQTQTLTLTPTLTETSTTTPTFGIANFGIATFGLANASRSGCRIFQTGCQPCPGGHCGSNATVLDYAKRIAIQYKLFNVPYIASESEARMVFLGGHPAKY